MWEGPQRPDNNDNSKRVAALRHLLQHSAARCETFGATART